MAFKNIVIGQRDWLDKINQALSLASAQVTEIDNVTFVDGWTVGDYKPKLRKYPFSNGTSMIILQFDVHKTMKPNLGGDFALMPDGYSPSLNFPLGGQVSVNYGGHIGGYLDLYSVPGKVCYKFWPNNGGVDGEANKDQDIHVRGSIAWI